MNKKYSYDKEADAIYITLSDNPVAYTKPLDDTRIIDYDNKNMPVGIELLCVSEGVIIEGLPSLSEVTPILEKEHIKGFYIAPASEIWLFKNPKAIASVRRGLLESAQGRASKINLDTL